MGYTTDFTGSLELAPKATPEQVKYINTFSSTRRMKRDTDILMKLFNGEHGLNGNYGIDGEFFCKDDGNFGQSQDESIKEYNKPPTTQPGLWCQWVLSEDGAQLEWDGNEKFYKYTQWIQYMIENFFTPWGITLNGNIEYQGEDTDDKGVIMVRDNKVVVMELL